MTSTSIKSGRIKAIDLLRGMTVAGMIVVNNPGSWGHIYPPLRHADWNGMTPTDLVFPFFLFIMGVSMYISLSKFQFQPSRELYAKIAKRTLLLILIGWLVSIFSFFLRNWYALGEDPTIDFWTRLGRSLWAFPHLRILGVFPRLGLTYGIAALLTIWLSHNRLKAVFWVTLVLYALLLLLGNGYEYGEENILSHVDRTILTPAHMYSDNGIDPEGILSTISATMQVVAGVLIGHILMTNKEDKRLVQLFHIGVTLALFGYIVSWFLPLNKKIWSPSFVLVTCGLATLFLASLIYLVDHNKRAKWLRFFTPFGANALATYLASTILSLLFLRIRIPIADGYTTVYRWSYESLCQLLVSSELASLAYALLFLLINWSIGYTLYRNKIFIKI